MPVAFHPPSLPTPEGARAKPADAAERAADEGDAFSVMLAAAAEGTRSTLRDDKLLAESAMASPAMSAADALSALAALLTPFAVPVAPAATSTTAGTPPAPSGAPPSTQTPITSLTPDGAARTLESVTAGEDIPLDAENAPRASPALLAPASDAKPQVSSGGQRAADDRAVPRMPFADVAPAQAAAAPRADVAPTPPVPDAARGELPPVPSVGNGSQLSAATPLAATNTPPPISIETSVGAPGWRDDAARTIAHAVVLRHDKVEVHVHPAELGPVSVRIEMDGNSATVLITAPQPATRDALELALPGLRQLLAEQGIALGQATVQDERPPPFADGREPPRDASALPSRHPGASDESAPAAAVPIRRGLIDLFA